MGFPHRHYHDHLTLRAGLDNVSARFISVLSRETALLITCLRSCSIAEKLSAQSDLGKHRQPRRRRKRRVTRLLHQWHCWELPLSLKGQHVLRDWPSSERRIMERKLHRVYNSQWSGLRERTLRSVMVTVEFLWHLRVCIFLVLSGVWCAWILPFKHI